MKKRNGRPEKAGGGFVEVALSDNGPGIPAEQLGRLFEPFFTTKASGVGPGLALAPNPFICFWISLRQFMEIKNRNLIALNVQKVPAEVPAME
jgi:hypothetical protein